MVKPSYLIFIFLTLSVSTAFGQSEDFAKTLQNKLNLYYSNNIPVNLQLFFNQPAYAPGDTAFFKISFFTAQENKFIGGRQVINVTLVTRNGKTLHLQKVLINDGWGFSQLILPADISPGIYEIVAYSDWMKNHDPSNYYYSPLIVTGENVFKADETQELKLYPEGGNFVAEVQNKVVVVGKPLTEVSVIDKRKSIVATCALDSLGLGAFMITPHLTEEYHVFNGKTEAVLLRSAESKVSILITSLAASEKIMNVALQVTDSSQFSNAFYFVISAENKIVYSATLNFRNAGRINIAIPKHMLPFGICVATLFRHDKTVEATRLVNIEKNTVPKIYIETNEDVFAVREKVTLKIRVNNSKGEAEKARLGVSVYAQDLFLPHHQNSLKDLLYNAEQLSIANMTGQFAGLLPEQLDNIMITQSQKRFSWPDVWNEVRNNKHTFKANLHFKGRVIMDNMKPSDSTTIDFFLNKDVRTYEGDIAKDGSFDLSLFFDFEGEDEVFYMVRQNGKIRKDAKVIMDESNDLNLKLTSFEKSSVIDRYGIFSSSRREIEMAYKTRSIDKIKTQGSSPHALLEDEVDQPDVSINLDDYLVMPTMEETLREIVPLLQHRWRNKNHTIRIHLLDPDVMTEDDPLYFIDGVLTDNTEYFMGLKPDDVASIKVVCSQRKLNNFGLFGKSGIVLVETKIPNNAAKVPKCATFFRATGLTEKISFQNHDLAGKQFARVPYLMPTLYWNPDVRTDENGFATISFYTGDNTGTFRVKINGTSISNENVFAEKDIEVKFGPWK